MDPIDVKPEVATSDTSSDKLKNESSDKEAIKVSNVGYHLKSDRADLDFGEVPEPEEGHVVHNAADIVTQVISLEDDPTLNPWTRHFRFCSSGDFLL